MGPGQEQGGFCTHIWSRASPGEPVETSLLLQHAKRSIWSQGGLLVLLGFFRFFFFFCLTNYSPAL